MAKRITNTEFINSIAELTDIESKAAAKRIYKGLVDIVTKELSKGNAISLTGLGTIMPVKSKARTMTNQFTGGTIEVPAKVHPKFKFAPSFKQAIN